MSLYSNNVYFKNPLTVSRWVLIGFLFISGLSFFATNTPRHGNFVFFNYTLGLPLLLLLLFSSMRKGITRHLFWSKFRDYLSPHLSLLFIIFILTIFLSSITVINIEGFFTKAFTYIKIFFFRVVPHLDNPFSDYHMRYNDILWILKKYKTCLFLASTLFIGNAYLLYQKKDFKILYTCLAIFIFLILNITIASRATGQDTIWNHAFFFAFIFGSLRLFLEKTSSFTLKKIVGLLVLLSCVNMFSNTPFSFTGNNYRFDYNYNAFFNSVFEDNKTSLYRKIMTKSYPDIKRKSYIKRRLLRPFHYALSLNSLSKGKFSILDVSLPYEGAFWIRNQNKGKLLVKGCPETICDKFSFIVSSNEYLQHVNLTPKPDTKIYAIRAAKTPSTNCQKFLSKGNNMFFYQVNCYRKYKIDKFHRGFIIVENTTTDV